jgi:hypothetical protein
MNKINDLVVFSRWRDEDERRHPSFRWFRFMDRCRLEATAAAD